MKRVFCEENGYEAQFYYSLKNDEQIAAAQKMIQDEVDYLRISAAGTSGWDTVLQDAQDAGIQVILYDRTIQADDSLYVAAVISDMAKEGETAVTWLADQGLEEYNIIHIQGTMGSAAQEGRTGALDAKVAAEDNWNMVTQQTADWNAETAQQIVQSVIDGGQEFNVIYAENDDIAKGAVAALDASGITHDKDGDVIVMGFDCNKWALEEVLAGRWNYDGQCNPFQADTINEIIQGLENGEEPAEKMIYLEEKGFDAATITQQLGTCSIAVQQMVAIARAVDMDCKVLILDEPTSSLDEGEVEKLFTLMRDLRLKGVGILFVNHFMDQVYAVCDRITVLRNGTFVGEYPVDELPRVKLVAAMMGKDFDDLASIKPEGFDTLKDAPMQIEAQGLSHKGTIKPFDLNLRKGEVIGLTGLLGSGRSELARVIYGADKAQTGTLKVAGKEAKINQPIDAMQMGMGLLPDDRKAEGIIGDLSVRENIILALQAKRGMFHLIPRAQQDKMADHYIKMLQIKTASRETPIKQLSGGNQQKVILGRWLATDPDFLILDEPTRGIDVGTKTEIQKLVLKLAAEGKSVTFISSEIDEMLRTCNRMAVLRDGAKVGELEGELTQERVMSAIAGGFDE